MPSGPWKSGSHIPDRSGTPPDIRPGFCGFAPAEAGADWAGKSEGNATAAPSATIKTAMRIRILSFLPGCRLLYSDRPGSAWPLTTTFKMNVRAGNSHRRAISRGMRVDRDVISRLHRTLAPSGAHHMNRGGELDRPMLHFPSFILGVHIDDDVG